LFGYLSQPACPPVYVAVDVCVAVNAAVCAAVCGSVRCICVARVVHFVWQFGLQCVLQRIYIHGTKQEFICRSLLTGASINEMPANVKRDTYISTWYKTSVNI